MGELRDGLTIAELFGSAVASHGDRPFFAVPANDKRDYLPGGFEISYRDADRRIAELSAAYRSAGFGLGLSIVKWIVDSHGGRIEAKSQVGRGTEFTVRLPLLDSGAPPSLSDGSTERRGDRALRST